MSLTLPTFAPSAVINAVTMMDMCRSTETYTNEEIAAAPADPAVSTPHICLNVFMLKGKL